MANTYSVKANVKKITAMETDINMLHKINQDQTSYKKKYLTTQARG